MTNWHQQVISLPPFSRGFHLVTHHIESALSEFLPLHIGLAHLFIQHTSASLSINENADPDVPLDLETAISLIVPESFPFEHTIEGVDDMPAHVKSSLLGSSVTIPIRQGRLALGTWQGIYLCEHRNESRCRSLVLTVWGQPL